jgi:hypothetical protein
VRADPPSLGGKMLGQRYHIVVRRQFDPHLPGGAAERHRRLPLSLLTGFVQSLLLGHGIVGWLVRDIPPLLVPQAPELCPDGRADVVPCEHFTRHLGDLISRSGAGGVHEDLGTPSLRADRYLIAESAAQCGDKFLPAGLQLVRQATERNKDAPLVVHKRTIATLRTRTSTITAAPSPTISAKRSTPSTAPAAGCGVPLEPCFASLNRPAVRCALGWPTQVVHRYRLRARLVTGAGRGLANRSSQRDQATRPFRSAAPDRRRRGPPGLRIQGRTSPPGSADPQARRDR